MENQFESSNINSLWLQNIYENIKNIEEMQRLAGEGCATVFNYLQIPQQQRQLLLAETQFKNLRLIIGEMKLLLADLIPVINEDQYKKFIKKLNELSTATDNPKLFIKGNWSASTHSYTQSQVKPFFYQTLNYLYELKVDIIKEIAHILYIKERTHTEAPWTT